MTLNLVVFFLLVSQLFEAQIELKFNLKTLELLRLNTNGLNVQKSPQKIKHPISSLQN